MSAWLPPPRWRSARPDPHKGAGFGETFLTGGFRGANRLSGHLPFTTRSASRPELSGRVYVRSSAVAQGCRSAHGAGAPDSACHLGSQGDDGDIVVRAGEKSTQPCSNCRVALSQQRHGRSRTLDQHLTKISASALRDPQEFGSSPVLAWRRTRPNQAARSRPLSKVAPSPTAATSAVAFSAPMPGMLVSRRARSSVRAMAANSASKAAIRRSSSSQRVRMSPSRNAIRGLNGLAPQFSRSLSRRRSRA